MAQSTLTRVLDDLMMLTPDELRKVEQALRTQIPKVPAAARTTSPSSEEVAAANAKLRETIVTLGYATGADNTSIDTDLAREYSEDHADPYLQGGKR